MATDRKPFETIEGGATPRRSEFADGMTLLDCPVCKREDGLEHSKFAVLVRGVLSDGRLVRVDYASETDLICLRCFAMERGGLHHRPGLVALWTESEGWVRLDKV